MKEEFLDRKLQERSAAGALRVLRVAGGQADYYSNDYLGISKNGLIEGALPRSLWRMGPQDPDYWQEIIH